MAQLIAGLHHVSSLDALARPDGGPDKAFATTFLTGFMEWACVEALRPALAEDQTSFGTLIFLNQEDAADPGSVLTVRAELVDVNGDRLLFKIECLAGERRISTGFHERRLTATKRLAA